MVNCDYIGLFYLILAGKCVIVKQNHVLNAGKPLPQKWKLCIDKSSIVSSKNTASKALPKTTFRLISAGILNFLPRFAHRYLWHDR